MFNPFKGMQDLNEMRKKAAEMQKILSAERVIVDKNGVHLVMTGNQKILEFTIDGYEPEERVTKAIEEAIKKAQELAARKLLQLGS